jgi:hypothetical protein
MTEFETLEQNYVMDLRAMFYKKNTGDAHVARVCVYEKQTQRYVMGLLLERAGKNGKAGRFSMYVLTSKDDALSSYENAKDARLSTRSGGYKPDWNDDYDLIGLSPLRLASTLKALPDPFTIDQVNNAKIREIIFKTLQQDNAEQQEARVKYAHFGTW